MQQYLISAAVLKQAQKYRIEAASVYGCVLRSPLSESYSKTAYQTRRASPSPCSAPLFNYQAIVFLLIIGPLSYIRFLQNIVYYIVRRINAQFGLDPHYTFPDLFSVSYVSESHSL